jgi:hypothetical protein
MPHAVRILEALGRIWIPAPIYKLLGLERAEEVGDELGTSPIAGADSNTVTE